MMGKVSEMMADMADMDANGRICISPDPKLPRSSISWWHQLPRHSFASTPERCLGLDEDDFMINATMFNDMIILDPCSTPKLGFVALHIYI
jgi:hypothetical protein